MTSAVPSLVEYRKTRNALPESMPKLPTAAWYRLFEDILNLQREHYRDESSGKPYYHQMVNKTATAVAELVSTKEERKLFFDALSVVLQSPFYDPKEERWFPGLEPREALSFVYAVTGKLGSQLNFANEEIARLKARLAQLVDQL